MEIDELPENDERLLKKPEINRDAMGRFEQAGTGLIKKSQAIKRPKHGHGGLRAGAGRPRGSKNKISLALKEMILNSLDRVGGEEYLMRLAIENSSAFASLLGKVLPTTLQASESDGGNGRIEFRRIIVWPGRIEFRRIIVWPGGREEVEGSGREEVEGITPKQLPAPASHTLPSDDIIDVEAKEIKDLEG